MDVRMNWYVKKAYFKGIGIGCIRKRFGFSLFEFFAGIGLCWQRESRVAERAKPKQIILKNITTSADELTLKQ